MAIILVLIKLLNYVIFIYTFESHLMEHGTLCSRSQCAQAHTPYRSHAAPISLYIWSNSDQGHTFHMVTIFTGSHSAEGHTLHKFTLCKGSHSAQGHSLQRVKLCTGSYFVLSYILPWVKHWTECF